MLTPGTTVERYIVLHLLGVGGMAVVYAVRHEILGTRHALKVLSHAAPTVRERLILEGQLQARLDPRHVVPVQDVLSVQGAPALLMPLVQGCSLAELLQQHRPSEPEAAALFTDIAHGVASAHAAGVVHRDLKPANVLLDQDRGRVRVRVADFGLARASAAAKSTRTRDGALLGTPAYAAPEQLADARSVDARADLWSLGVVLFELLTGRRPFHGADRTGQGRGVGRYDEGSIPAPWRPVVRGLLQVDPQKRTPSVEVVNQQVAALLEPAPLVVGTPIAEVLRRQVEAPQVDRPVASEATATAVGTWLLEDAAEGPQHSLPHRRDSFVGRDEDLDLLDRRVLQGARLNTLLGMGGTGKTRLAVEYGWRTLDRFPGGVWFCDLTEARSVDGIARAVARSLDVPLGRDPLEQLGHAIAGRGRCLVILDNFEQVVEHAQDTVGRWLQAVEDASFLITSREVLGVSEEALLPLAPLDVTDAATLFEQRAVAVKPEFRPTGSERGTILELVSLLDGLPLAIELAAARVRIMTPASLLARMHDRFRLLTSQGGRPDRHATMRATLDWSWDLLQPDEQRALAQLSVFEGGFSLDAVEAVVELPDTWALDALQGLVQKSWVRTVADDRFTLLVTVQAYGRDRLDGLGERTATELRHADFFARMGTPESIEALHRHGGTARVRELNRDLDNLEVACRRAIQRADGATGVDLFVAAAEVLVTRGPIALVRELGRPLRDLPMPETARARLLVLYGRALDRYGQREQARTMLEEGLACAIRAGDAPSEAAGHIGLGMAELNSGRPDEARAHLEAAVAVHRRTGWLSGEGRALRMLSFWAMRAGRPDQSIKLAERSLSIARQTGDPILERSALHTLAITHDVRGDHDRARDLLTQALEINLELGDLRGLHASTCDLGVVLCTLGDLEGASRSLDRAISVARKIGNQLKVALCLGNRGNVHLRAGALARARSDLTQAVGGLDAAWPPAAAAFRASLGVVEAREGDVQAGRALLVRAEAVMRKTRDRAELGLILAKRAEVEALAGEVEAATTALDEARRLARDLGLRPESALRQAIARSRAHLGPSSAP